MTAICSSGLSRDRKGAVVSTVSNCLLPRAALTRGFTLLFISMWMATPMFSQCQMCKTAAAVLQEKSAGALNAGIVVLGIPPAAILIGIGGLAYRYRNRSGLE